LECGNSLPLSAAGLLTLGGGGSDAEKYVAQFDGGRFLIALQQRTKEANRNTLLRMVFESGG
jgi:hypothetical protein